MLDYKVELKGKGVINSLCYDAEDGSKGQDGIGFNYDVLESNNFLKSKVTGAFMYNDDSYAVKLTNNDDKSIYIHLDWINRFDGNKVLDTPTKLSDILLKVTRKHVIDTKTFELKNISDIPMCGCGALGVHTMDDGKVLCNECKTNLIKVNNYSYKPTPNFIGKQLHGDKEHNVWYGIEVEVSTNKTKLEDYMYKYGASSLYLKDDSSIRGDNFRVEIVSHPHSFNALMSNDSWMSNIDMIPTENKKENGCHVHISRTAFKDDKHYSLFYFLIHDMVDICTKVGGRELTNYCELSPSGKVHSKKNGRQGSNRSLFLNEQPIDTVEARFFKGTTKSKNLKAYIQLLESLIKYTKYHSKTVTSKGWFGYITKKSDKYAELLKVIGKVDVEKLVHTVTYKEPKKVIVPIGKLLVSQINGIVEITDTSGDIVKVEHGRTYIGDENRCIYYVSVDDSNRGSVNDSTRGSRELLHKIESVVVEES